MPPVAPVTSAVSPSRRPPSTTMCVQTVSPASGIAAASTSDRLSGTRMHCPAGAATRVASPPPPRRAIARSPSRHPSTPSPTASTVPAHSRPGTSGSPGGGG